MVRDSTWKTIKAKIVFLLIQLTLKLFFIHMLIFSPGVKIIPLFLFFY